MILIFSLVNEILSLREQLPLKQGLRRIRPVVETGGEQDVFDYLPLE